MTREKLTGFILLAIYSSAIAGVLAGVLSGFQAGMTIAIMVFCAVFSYKYPRMGLWALLIYLPFSGTITYALGNVYRTIGDRITYSPDYALFHLLKDAFYIPALISLIQTYKPFKQLQPKAKLLLAGLLVLVAVCLATLLFVNLPQQLQVQNKESPFIMGILGLKELLGYIPLILCSYYLIRNKNDLFFFTRLQVIVILICCGLGFLQYLGLVTGLCSGNLSLGGEAINKASLQARCFVGGSLLYNPELGLIRLPGTFVAPWQWGWFLISSSFVTYAASTSDPSRRWRLLGWIAMIAVLIMTILSGQRIAVAIVPATFVFLLLLTDKHKHFLPFKLSIVVLLGVWITRTLSTVEERLNSFVDRWEASPPLPFMIDQFKWVIQQQDNLLGNGLGRATNAARRLGETKLIETYYAKLLYEIGPIGMFAFLALVSILTILTFKAYHSLKKPRLQSLGICLWVFIVFISYNTYYYPLAVDPVDIYYWFFIGILLKLPALDTHKEIQN